jgi:hypothetical protein
LTVTGASMRAVSAVAMIAPPAIVSAEGGGRLEDEGESYLELVERYEGELPASCSR